MLGNGSEVLESIFVKRRVKWDKLQFWVDVCCLGDEPLKVSTAFFSAFGFLYRFLFSGTFWIL